MKLKRIAIFLLFIITLNFLTSNIKVFAAINEEYISQQTPNGLTDLGSNSTLLNWTAEIGYNIAYAVEGLGSKIMQNFTGKYIFPSMDKIIFNAIPILDVNFISPSAGSFFLKSDGVTPTVLGEIIKNIYFTSLAISISFLTILVIVLGVRLAISSMGESQAKYKEGIKSAVLALILVFGMHYILSFVFYVNEVLVNTASSIITKLLDDGGTDVIKNLEAAGDEDNEQMVYNFLMKNNDRCFVRDIPIVGEIWQGLMDVVHAIGRAFEAIGKAIVGWFTGENNDQDGTIAAGELEKVYPSLDDYNEWFARVDRDGNARNTKNYTDEDIALRTNVAAYILKSKFYRTNFLDWASGTDANKFDNAGFKGIVKNALICVNDVLGVADNGYKAVKALFTSTALVVHGVDSKELEIKLTEKDAYDHLSGDIQEEYKKQKSPPGDANFDSEYYVDRITSVEQYFEYAEQASENLSKAQEESDENTRKKKILAAQLDILYANAYYTYCLPESEKPKIQANQLLTGLVDYFKGQSWYVDIEGGGWAPDYINPTAAILYTILILQSLILFIAYIKRFFYVMILSMMAPFVVIYDFATKII